MAADLYARLGVSPGAGEAELRRAYLELARRHHPDRLSGGSADERERASERMAQINAAWAVLGDRQRRAEYDAERAGVTLADGSTRIRPATHDFAPYDDGPDWIDPRLLDETSSTKPVHRAVTFAPVVFLAAGAASLVLGFAVGIVGLMAIGLVFVVLAGVSFLVVPLVALANSSEADRRAGR